MYISTIVDIVLGTYTDVNNFILLIPKLAATSSKLGLNLDSELYANKYGDEKKCTILTITRMKIDEYKGIPLNVNTKDKPNTTPGIANDSKLMKCNALLEIFLPDLAVIYAEK